MSLILLLSGSSSASATTSYNALALIQKTQINTSSVVSLILKNQTTTSSMDALISRGSTSAHSVDAFIRRTQTSSSSVDSLVLKTQTKESSVDASVTSVAQPEINSSVDALLSKTATVANSVDALILKRASTSHSVDSVVNQSSTKSSSVDCLVLRVQTKTHSVDARISRQFSISHLIDSLLKKRRTASNSVDTNVSGSDTVFSRVQSRIGDGTFAREVLYAAKGGSASLNSSLYMVDPATGSLTRLGCIGEGITGLAFDPTDSSLYGETSNSAENNRRLLRIDPSGSVTIGDHTDFWARSDLTFDAAGQLYGWKPENPGKLTVIDKTDATVTDYSNALTGTNQGGAIDVHPGTGVAYVMPRKANGNLYTVNLTNGAMTSLGLMDGGNYPISAASFDEDGLLWIVLNKSSGEDTTLATLDVATRHVTEIALIGNGWMFDALAWGPEVDFSGLPAYAPNDDFVDAETITYNVHHTGNTVCAGLETFDEWYALDNTVWYKYVAEASGLRVATANPLTPGDLPGFYVYVFSGPDINNLTLLDGESWSLTRDESVSADWTAVNGTTYWIQISSDVDSDFDLYISNVATRLKTHRVQSYLYAPNYAAMGCGNWLNPNGFGEGMMIEPAARYSFGSSHYRGSLAYQYQSRTFADGQGVSDGTRYIYYLTEYDNGFTSNYQYSGNPYFVRYDTQTNEYLQLSNPPTARFWGNAVWLNDKVYFFGGSHGNGFTALDVSQVDVYDPSNDTWSTAANMPSVYGGNLAVVTYNDKAYLFQTISTSAYVWEYDPIADTYSSKTAPSSYYPLYGATTTVQFFCNAVLRDGTSEIHFFEGFTTAGGFTDSSSVHSYYDVDTDTWFEDVGTRRPHADYQGNIWDDPKLNVTSHNGDFFFTTWDSNDAVTGISAWYYPDSGTWEFAKNYRDGADYNNDTSSYVFGIERGTVRLNARLMPCVFGDVTYWFSGHAIYAIDLSTCDSLRASRTDSLIIYHNRSELSFYTTGFEHGVGDKSNDVIVESSGTVGVTTAQARTGSYSYKVENPGGTNAYGRNWPVPELDVDGQFTLRFYVKIPTLPISGEAYVAEIGFEPFALFSSRQGYNIEDNISIIYDADEGLMRLRNRGNEDALGNHFTASTILGNAGLDEGEWNKIEVRSGQVGPGAEQDDYWYDWRINDIDQPRYQPSLYGANPVRFGFNFINWGGEYNSSAAYTEYIDDFVLYESKNIWPVGDGRVLALQLCTAGTHNLPEDFVNDDSSAIDDETPGRLDEIILAGDTSQYIQQTTKSTSAYLEFLPQQVSIASVGNELQHQNVDCVTTNLSWHDNGSSPRDTDLTGLRLKTILGYTNFVTSVRTSSIGSHLGNTGADPGILSARPDWAGTTTRFTAPITGSDPTFDNYLDGLSWQVGFLPTSSGGGFTSDTKRVVDAIMCEFHFRGDVTIEECAAELAGWGILL